MGWVQDTWDEITSGGKAVTETYNGSGSGNSGTSGGRNLDADNFAGSNYIATANDDDSGSNADGVGVKFEDSGNAGYIHTAASYGDYNDGNNFIPDDQLSFYLSEEDYKAYQANPTNTSLTTKASITAEQYSKGKKIAKMMGALAGPLGLGLNAILELQKRGVIPGNDPTAYLKNRDVQEQTNTDTENKILQMIEEGATNEEIEDALDEIAMQEEMAAKINALDTMSDAAFGESSAADVALNPEGYFSDTYNQDNINTDINENAAGTSIDSSNFQQGANPDVLVDTVTNTETANNVQEGNVSTYTANTVSDTLKNNPLYSADAQQGTITDKELVDANDFTIDVDAAAAGQGAVGEAINDYASQNISKVIDTSTVAGKLLAQELGEGNYTDSKSTILGQMDIISSQFVDGAGNPKIPPWAQGMAREVSRTIAFKGMTGTAATAAMATAIMEASLGVAEKEAAFFQTVTLKNLDNRQESIINKANILSKFEVANLDARMTAAVNNAKSFLQMNLANLDNRQQTELLNTQARIDGLLEDSKAINAANLFAADAENDFAKFYDNLNTQINIHRADTLNAMRKFNTGEINDNREFQASLDFNREKFYKDLQYNIELENARWRQSVTLKEAEMEFDAAKSDAENMFALMSEGLSQTWDREDAYFDYLWKTSETELERMVDLYEIDKEYEVEMMKANNDAAYKTGQADWELFKWGWDLVDDFDWDFWA